MTMKFNAKMRNTFEVIRPSVGWHVFFDTVVDGINEDQNGCILSKVLRDKAINVCLNDFVDLTGFEAFINSFHIDDYVEDANNWLATALLLAGKIKSKDSRLCIIISMDDVSCTIRFHCNRFGEKWLAEDIEGYLEDAVMII